MIEAWPTGTTEVAPGVFAYVQEGGGFCVANAGIIRAPGGGATVIDALFTPAMTRALLGEVQRVAGGPPERLINTHHHVDHTLGNALFPAEAPIVAHARARAEMQRNGMGVLRVIERIAPYFTPELEGAAERLPDTTFDGDSLALDIGGRELRLLHYGTGHTRGDVVALLPAERVAFLGDIGFFHVTPMAIEGHIGNWITVGRRIIDELAADVLVPGHGPVGTKDDLAVMLGYFERLRDGARAAFEAGVGADEAAASIDLGEYAAWGEAAERAGLNVARLYAEFRGELDRWLA